MQALETDSRVIFGKQERLLFTALLLLVTGLFILDILFGSVSIVPSDVVKAFFTNTGSNFDTIILKFRLPKAITALAVGIGLSLSGLQMQTVFRNPMAGPYVLGISSGASLGVAFVILGFSGNISPESLKGLGNWILVVASWAGAGAVMVLVMIISSRVKDIMTILILGIMIASGISAVVTIMQYFSNETMLKAYVIWTMGSLGNLTSSQLNVLLLSVSVGVLLSMTSVKMLNALLLGENYASSIGLNVKFSRVIIFACTSILAGSVTAFCGPIGFIGIAVPHITRILFRTSNHKILVPGTILTGGAVMLVSDIISQLPGSESVLPINSVTSLVGIPVVIWVILRNRKYSGLF
ncbi:MAG: iron ABC transporter permease [Bacteroidetes bacterium]|nr:MAG: iron ABC transporter permease [Bacteroidota bacterium]